jgi:hypothetical protein
MRIHRWAGFLAGVLWVVAAFTNCALANSKKVDMTLVGVGTNNAGGVYTYPYYFSINGGAPVALICDSYDNRVEIGESWQANVVGLLSGKGLFGNQLLDYKAAGLIFKSILNGTVNVNVGNYAIWGLFSTNAQDSQYFQQSGAGTLMQQYLTLAATAPNGDFKGLYLYTPIGGTQSWGGMPQEYIGYSPVPEPGSMTLLGTGLISMGGMVRRKLKRNQA